MNKFLLLLLLSIIAQSNELVFNGIKKQKTNNEIVEFKLDKVSYGKVIHPLEIPQG